VKVDPIEAAKLAAVLVVGFLAWRAYRTVSDAAGAAGDYVAEAWDGLAGAAEQLYADAHSAVVNTFSLPPEPGEKAFLYSDANYTGVDPATGLTALDGARADPEFRRYEYQQREAGNAPAATSIEGAAFGVYPAAGRRRRG